MLFLRDFAILTGFGVAGQIGHTVLFAVHFYKFYTVLFVRDILKGLKKFDSTAFFTLS